MDTGLLVLRMIVGLALIGHGAQKLFGWFRGGGLVAAAWFFRSVGYRPPRLMATLAGGAELVGGAAFAVGFATPVAAGAVIATMLNATVTVYRRNDLLTIDGGYQYPLGMAAMAATIGFTGAGATSLDATLGLAHPGVTSGFLVVALGLAAGFGVFFSRAATGSETQPVSELLLIDPLPEDGPNPVELRKQVRAHADLPRSASLEGRRATCKNSDNM